MCVCVPWGQLGPCSTCNAFDGVCVYRAAAASGRSWPAQWPGARSRCTVLLRAAWPATLRLRAAWPATLRVLPGMRSQPAHLQRSHGCEQVAMGLLHRQQLLLAEAGHVLRVTPAHQHHGRDQAQRGRRQLRCSHGRARGPVGQACGADLSTGRQRGAGEWIGQCW